MYIASILSFSMVTPLLIWMAAISAECSEYYGIPCLMTLDSVPAILLSITATILGITFLARGISAVKIMRNKIRNLKKQVSRGSRALEKLKEQGSKYTRGRERIISEKQERLERLEARLHDYLATTSKESMVDATIQECRYCHARFPKGEVTCPVCKQDVI